jgi:hypothetical protein
LASETRAEYLFTELVIVAIGIGSVVTDGGDSGVVCIEVRAVCDENSVGMCVEVEEVIPNMVVLTESSGVVDSVLELGVSEAGLVVSVVSVTLVAALAVDETEVGVGVVVDVTEDVGISVAGFVVHAASVFLTTALAVDETEVDLGVVVDVTADVGVSVAGLVVPVVSVSLAAALAVDDTEVDVGVAIDVAASAANRANAARPTCIAKLCPAAFRLGPITDPQRFEQPRRFGRDPRQGNKVLCDGAGGGSGCDGISQATNSAEFQGVPLNKSYNLKNQHEE